MTDLVSINTAIADLIASLGLGTFASVLVQLIKMTGIVPDGMGGSLYTILCVIGFAVFTILGTFGFDLDGPTATNLFNILALVGKLLAAILSGFGLFSTARKAQAIGYRAGGKGG